MATKPNLSQLKHVLVPSMLHFYYEPTEDGNVLRHIRVNRHLFAVPSDITIDSLPDDVVGTGQIQDGSVQPSDLNQEVKEMIDAGNADIVVNDDPVSLLDD